MAIKVILFQSTQPKRAATELARHLKIDVYISIHAAQEGCDQRGEPTLFDFIDFNPRSPRGLRPLPPPTAESRMEFQSTQPKRAATSGARRGLLPGIFQSTQPKRAATLKIKSNVT